MSYRLNKINFSFLPSPKNISTPKYCSHKKLIETPKKFIDKEYIEMISYKKELSNVDQPEPHTHIKNSKIYVIVRKRPLSQKEVIKGEIDCITCKNPQITVHECKKNLDGITKYIEDHQFYFDNVFSEEESTEDIYNESIYPIIDLIFQQGIITCFAYGQTGSGKTYTMKGIQNLSIENIYKKMNDYKKILNIYISFYEIYGDKIFDLLNNKNKLQALDDKNGKTHIYGLKEVLVSSKDELLLLIKKANSIRATHNTITNETSSRSHAICIITLKEKKNNKLFGKLSLVDLAGSERAQETQSNNKQRREEGKNINKSLLALKECIRALYKIKINNEINRFTSDIHIPFRASKLTHVLRDSFMDNNNNCKIVMISCVNPCYSSTNHTINTLRYSDRLKEKTIFMKKINLKRNHNNKRLVTSYNKTRKMNHLSKKWGSLRVLTTNSNDYINMNEISRKHTEKTEKRINKIDINDFGHDVVKETDDMINDININFKLGAEDFLEISEEFKEIKSYKFNSNYNSDDEKVISPKNKSSTDASGGKDNSNSNNFEKSNSNKDYNITKITSENWKDNCNSFEERTNIKINKSYNQGNKIVFSYNKQNTRLNNNNNIEDYIHVNKTERRSRKRLVNDCLIKYLKLSNKIIDDENSIIDTHIDILRQNAIFLTEEGELISKIRNMINNKSEMNNYLKRIEEILESKINNYTGLQNKINNYKNNVKKEKELKKYGFDCHFLDISEEI